MNQALSAPNTKVKFRRTWLEQQHVTRTRFALALHHPIINKHRSETIRRPATQGIAFGRARNRGARAGDQPDTVKPAHRIAPVQPKARADQRAGAGNGITAK